MTSSTTSSSTTPTSLTLSPSKLSSFTKCGRNYRFHYIDKLPDPPTIDTVRGTVVHRALELFYLAYAGDQCTVAHLDACTDEALEEGAADIAAVGACGPTFTQEVRILARNIFMAEDPTQIKVLATEQRIHEPIGPYEMRGVIDRVDLEADGSVTLVDYKTGKVPAKRDEDDRLRAMFVYAHLWELSNGTEHLADRVKLVYLKGTPKKQKPITITADVTTSKMAFAISRTLSIGMAIEDAIRADYFGPSPSPLCGWCPYRDRCPEGDAYLTGRGK